MRKFFTKKKIIWGVILLLVIGGIASAFFKPQDPSKNVVTETVKKQGIKQTVLATGQVVSGTDLNLSFKMGGIVQKVLVKESQQVKAGDQLAILDQKDQQATLTSARGSLAQAQANLRKVMDGASSEEVQVAQRAVDAAQVSLDNAKENLKNTQTQQKVLVDNSYQAMLNSGLSATPGVSNTSALTATVSGTYTSPEQGKYNITIQITGGGPRFAYSGLESGSGMISTSPQPLGTRGLFIKFSDTAVGTYSSYYWTVNIPNTESATYVANTNAYQASLEAQKSAIAAAEAAIRSAEVSLAQSQAQLQLKQSKARPADVQVAQAAVLSAEGQVQAASANLENTVIRAPADGTITKVDIKVGEQAQAMKAVMVLQDVQNLHVEANISEANISQLKTGQSVDFTLDALGPDRHFKGAVQTIDPASTVVSGVVNYKVTASLEKLEEIKPGMTANMTVLIAEKSQVVAVPLRSVFTKGGSLAENAPNSKYVRVVNDPKKKTYDEVTVTTGMEADGGLVEITSGLQEGQEIVTLIKK